MLEEYGDDRKDDTTVALEDRRAAELGNGELRLNISDVDFEEVLVKLDQGEVLELESAMIGMPGVLDEIEFDGLGVEEAELLMLSDM